MTDTVYTSRQVRGQILTFGRDWLDYEDNTDETIEMDYLACLADAANEAMPNVQGIRVRGEGDAVTLQGTTIGPRLVDEISDAYERRISSISAKGAK